MNQISSLLTFIGNRIKKYDKIQGGREMSINVAANSYTDKSVTFSKAFSSTPTVVAGMDSASTAAALGNITVSVTTVSATGFTARIFNAGSTGRSPGFYWIAVPNE